MWPKMTAEAQVDNERQNHKASGLTFECMLIPSMMVRIIESTLHNNQVRLRRHADVAISGLTVARGRAVTGRDAGHMRSMSIRVLSLYRFRHQSVASYIHCRKKIRMDLFR